MTEDKVLFTPGPLTTSLSVKLSMLRDLGSRDEEFIRIVKQIRRRLLALAGVSQEDGYEAIPMQGSGTFGIEAVISSATPPAGKWLFIINGAYGERMAQIAKIHRLAFEALTYAEDTVPVAAEVDRKLRDDAAITNVAIVHCETTTGIMNPIQEIGEVVARHGMSYFIDSMSAFGAVAIDLKACRADYLVSSANKCIEGVPGFSFAICRREALERTRAWARTLSLDLFAQWQGLEKNGQFRFTPPIQALLAFRQALDELAEEGGVDGRAARYKANHEMLVAGMRALGFREYLQPEVQGYIITSFYYPRDERFEFEDFYERLGSKGCVIYPGKLSKADCFRIGHVGRITPSETKNLLYAIRETLAEMDMRM